MSNDRLEDIFASALQKLEELPNYSDVTTWAKSKLGVDLWSVQQSIAASVTANPRTAVWSCHDSGKSFLAAVLTCHHIDTHPPKQARVITTAPSGHQVKGVLWVEINGLFEKAKERGNPLPGRVNQTEWWIGSYQAGIGRKPNEYNADQFAGFHARYPLVILDEADGLPMEMWEGVEALLTNRKARLFCIGNPIDAGSNFAQIRKNWEKGDDTYHGVVIPYNVTPNFSGEETTEFVKDVMLSKEWVETKRRQWGDAEAALKDPDYQPLDNPFWHGRVLAQYPPEDASTIMSMGMIQANTDPEAPVPQPSSYVVVQLGVDFAASEGGDYTVVRERVGDTALREWRRRTADDDEIEDFIVECANISGASRICTDGTGVGFGFTGRLKKRLPGVKIIPVQFAGRATVVAEDGKTRKFANLRAQLYWEVGRENLRLRHWNLAHMDRYEETVTDLTVVRLDAEALSKKQIIQVESKKEIKARLKRSPDSGDALLLAFHEPGGLGLTRIQSPGGRNLATRTATQSQGVQSSTRTSTSRARVAIGSRGMKRPNIISGRR